MTDLKIMPVEMCGAVGRCMSSPPSYEHEATPRWGAKPGPDRIAAFALAKLEEARARDVEIHERNLPALENNRAVREAVVALITSYEEDKAKLHRDLNEEVIHRHTSDSPKRE